MSEGTRTPDRLDHNQDPGALSGENADIRCSQVFCGALRCAQLRAMRRATGLRWAAVRPAHTPGHLDRENRLRSHGSFFGEA